MTVPKGLRGTVLSGVIGILVAACAAPAAEQQPNYGSVARAVERAMDSYGVPGVGIAVIDEFEVSWAGEFGLAEPGRAVQSDPLFQAASLSKPVSAVLAAAAAEEGLIDLESDALALTQRWRHPPPWWDGPITLRMLLAHRGGVNVHGFPGYQLSDELPDLPVILDGVLDKNEPIRVVTQPGEHNYSGGGFLIAEMAIEDHTGEEFEALADTLVFEPLGLELSTYRLLTSDDRARVAVGYRSNGQEVAGGGWHLYPETAPASLWTTAGEYAALVADVMKSLELGTGLLLEQETVQLLLDPDFAIGFGMGRERVGVSIGHLGANEGYRSGFTALPHLGAGIVIRLAAARSRA